VPVIIYPASVQGAGAPREIAAAIRAANGHARVDVLIVCRGGGSLEDLWAFNEEIVARAVFDSRIPIVSGVGHETDFTICDFVADLRAATPTAAAAAVVPDRVAFAHKLRELARHASRGTAHALAVRAQRLDHASRRLVHPAARIAAQRERAAALAMRLSRSFRLRLAAERDSVASLQACLAREMSEELDVPSRVGEEIFSTSHTYPERSVELHFFSCELFGEPRPMLDQEMRWVRRDELAALEFPPADAALITILMRPLG